MLTQLDPVGVRRDEATGDVVPSRRVPDWATFFALVQQSAVPADFMTDRVDMPPQQPELF